MLQFLSSLDPMQLILMGVGLFLAAPTIIDFFSDNNKKETKEVRANSNHSLTDIVCKWECLCDACETLRLEEAASKLEEVFPLLCKKKKSESSVNPLAK